MVTYRPTLNPAVLTWARLSLNLTEERAAGLIGVPPEQLRAWESGQPPTIVQLRTIAEKYRRPLGAFFLPDPPSDPLPPHDFRTIPGREGAELSTELLVEIRRARTRRELAIELLYELERRATPLQIRTRVDENPEEVGRRVRQHLGVRLQDQSGWTGEGVAFNGWKAAVEAKGVLVFQARRISFKEVRGFSLSERPLPVIVVNGSDYSNAKPFTLLHEFIHLTLNLEGICDPFGRAPRRRSGDAAVEVFCNHAAGAILVPAHSLLNQGEVQANDDPEGWTDGELNRLARTYSVSVLVVARRLLTLGRTTRRFYEHLQDRVVALAERSRQRRRQEGAPPRPVMVVSDLGRSFTGTVLDAYGSRVITSSDVSQYFRIKVHQIGDVQERLGLRTPE